MRASYSPHPTHTVTLLSERMTSVSHIRQWADRGRLFAILDATDVPEVPLRAVALGDSRAISLYKGRAEEDLSAIAPFLVQVDSNTLDWISGDLWPDPWGIFMLADVTLEQLRTHFRQFLIVRGPADESWYFRFYDPRVFSKYIDTCTADEVAEFFGPVLAFAITDLATYGVRVLTRAATSTQKLPSTPHAEFRA